MARDILQEILDTHNIWHRNQLRLINRAGHGERVLPIITQKDFRRRETARRIKEEKVMKEALKRTKVISANLTVTEREEGK